VLDVFTGKRLKSWTGHSDLINSVVRNHDDQGIVSGSADNTIKIWDVNNGELQSTLIGHTDQVTSLEWNRNGSILPSGSYDDPV
jgi:WD40 repeat protein